MLVFIFSYIYKKNFEFKPKDVSDILTFYVHQICVGLLIYKTIFRLLYDTQNFISHTQHIVESSVLNSVDARS